MCIEEVIMVVHKRDFCDKIRTFSNFKRRINSVVNRCQYIVTLIIGQELIVSRTGFHTKCKGITKFTSKVCI